jgi:hypothetical protein
MMSKDLKLKVFRSDQETGMAAYGQGLLAVGELTNCLPGTEAKLITKSRS